jgi:hypothetical protein
MYTNYGDTLYNTEADQRWAFYPGTKYFPELYIDGHRHAGIWYWLWEDTIVSRMNQPSPVSITMNGTYSSYRGAGTVTATYRNDSTSSIRGKVMFIVVEDSIYHVDVSGKNWHNHVAKDYIPGPNGQMITIPAGDSVTYSQPFTIPASWRYNYCSIVTFLQDTVVQPDAETKYVWQSGVRKVTQMIGVDEYRTNLTNPVLSLTASPNPFTRNVEFTINCPVSGRYSLDILNSAGRCIKSFGGETAANQRISIGWNGINDLNERVVPGVYFYYFRCPGIIKSGKIIAL